MSQQHSKKDTVHRQRKLQQQLRQKDDNSQKLPSTSISNAKNLNGGYYEKTTQPSAKSSILSFLTTSTTSLVSSARSMSSQERLLAQQQQQQQQQQHKQQQQQQKPNHLIQEHSTQKDKERAEREALVLWRHPIDTIKFCMLEMKFLSLTSIQKLLQQRKLLAALLVLSAIFSIIYCIPGPQQALIDVMRKNTWYFVYWIGLGVLSSVGLGTGLHTFLLYLGPHIASVTLAAYECNSLNFPKPPYPDEIICPELPYTKQLPNIWAIMSKVRLEAFLWGAGTALGELPPYFMAKAARLSGYDPEDAEEMAEFDALNAKRDQDNLSMMDRGKLFMERVVERIGFFGILACASIPNPLFDLAGITCGHFLVPFWTFFGATLIGKAIIKMHIQKIFVIIAFNETLIERAVDTLAVVPIFGKKLQEPFKGFLNNQKQRLHRQKQQAPGAESSNMLAKIFETFVICMVVYFIISIINSLAQSYHKRLHKKSSNVIAAKPTSTTKPSSIKTSPSSILISSSSAASSSSSSLHSNVNNSKKSRKNVMRE